MSIANPIDTSKIVIPFVPQHVYGMKIKTNCQYLQNLSHQFWINFNT